MKCPVCQHSETKVVDSRLGSDEESIRRRRECLKCEKRFTTYEYVEHVALMVVKRNGGRQAFDRKKIIAGLVKACEKRSISIDKIEDVTISIERFIQKKYDREISSKELGEIIMEKLSELDEVAYVRFASVYRQFQNVNQFMDELKKMLISKKKEEG